MGLATHLILSALGKHPGIDASDAELVEVTAGGMLIANGLSDLQAIRAALEAIIKGLSKAK